MSGTAPAKPRRPPRPIAVGLVAAITVIIGTLGHQSMSAANPGDDVRVGDSGGSTWEADAAVTAADGVLPDGVTVFASRYPGIANLDPGLLQALRGAATDAGDDGIKFYVHSAWRSPEYQNQLFREAVSRYGSRTKAARWVATADTSAHVSGDAIDVESDASEWLSAHGADYGLCRIYRNEAWHFELRPLATEHGCPRRYADVAHDPRMRQ